MVGQNGFTGSVQITLVGVPAGVLSNPASPFSIASGASTAVLFGASPNAALGNFTVTAPALFQNGLGTMARAGDHTKIFVAASDASGELGVFDATGAAIAGPHSLGAGTIPLVAANPDGSRFAVQFVSAPRSSFFWTPHSTRLRRRSLSPRKA